MVLPDRGHRVLVTARTLPRILWVAGGRTYKNRAFMEAQLARYLDGDWILITGAARGADTLAEKIFRQTDLPYIGIPAQWGKFGKGAGYERNRIIAEEWGPDQLLAFPGGRGTRMSVDLAVQFEIPWLLLCQ